MARKAAAKEPETMACTILYLNQDLKVDGEPMKTGAAVATVESPLRLETVQGMLNARQVSITPPAGAKQPTGALAKKIASDSVAALKQSVLERDEAIREAKELAAQLEGARREAAEMAEQLAKPPEDEAATDDADNSRSDGGDEDDAN